MAKKTATDASGMGKRRAAARASDSVRYHERRQALIKAAAKVFKNNGLADTSIDDIAKAVGVDRATLYYYVGGKRELFNEVVLGVLISNVEMAEQLRDSSRSTEEKLTSLFDGLLRSYSEYYPHMYVFLQEDTSRMESIVGSTDIVELQRRFDRALTAIVKEGADNGILRADVPPRLAAYGIIGMMNWTHRWFHPDGPVGPEEVARAFAAIAIDGLRKRD